MEDQRVPALHRGHGDLPVLLPGVRQPGGVPDHAVVSAAGLRAGGAAPGIVLLRLGVQADAVRLAGVAVLPAVPARAGSGGMEGPVVPRG